MGSLFLYSNIGLQVMSILHKIAVVAVLLMKLGESTSLRLVNIACFPT
ncbi:hypothetical protein [Hazenella coriacea]|nr:hypothetical protein [Hazenella coriacea]